MEKQVLGFEQSRRITLILSGCYKTDEGNQVTDSRSAMNLK